MIMMVFPSPFVFMYIIAVDVGVVSKSSHIRMYDLVPYLSLNVLHHTYLKENIEPKRLKDIFWGLDPHHPTMKTYPVIEQWYTWKSIDGNTHKLQINITWINSFFLS